MTFKSPEDFHHKLGLIFHGMLSLPLAAFVYLFLEIQNNDRSGVLDKGVFPFAVTVILPLLALTVFVYGYLSFKKATANLKEHKIYPLPVKFSAYYKNSLSLYIYIEVASVLLVLGLYLTASAVFILGYVFLLFFMSLFRPTPQKYLKDMPLTEKERDIILHKGSFEELAHQEEN